MNHYCYGLNRYDRNGITMYSHGGDANGIAAYTQYFFEDDLCIIILSNNESLNQYRLGEGIADILYGKEPQHAVKPDEIPVSEEDLRKFTGTYLPGKIHIEVKNGKLYLVRVNQNIQTENCIWCASTRTSTLNCTASAQIHLSAGTRSRAIRTICCRKALKNLWFGDMN